MTVSTQIVQRTYTGNGVNTVWEVDFPLAQAQDLQVWITSIQGEISQVENFDLNATHTEVIYPTTSSGQSPLGTGCKITLLRKTPITQGIDLLRQGKLDTEVLEQGYDKLTLISQELQSQITSNQTQITSNTTALASEAETRASADTTLQSNITAESSARAGAVTTLQNSIAAEATARQNGDTQLQTSLTAETTARQEADAALQTALDGKQASGDYATNTALSEGLDEKQGVIEDLETIRSGASAGATAVQPAALTTALASKQDSLSAAQLAAVNSGVTSSTVSQVQTNKEDIAALDAELDEDRPWQKPADWMDIRKGAVPNSVYFLVGHSADYATYPEFKAKITTSNSGSYDLFVDGIKQATTASNVLTTLNWQTLALTSGFDVTYPSALRTHIVRITPSVSTDKIASAYLAESPGVLWAHFENTTTTSLSLSSFAVNCYQLESVTSNQDSLKVTDMDFAFLNSTSLVNIPALDGAGATVSFREAFQKTKLKKIIINNAIVSGTFYNIYWNEFLKSIKGKNLTFKMVDSLFGLNSVLETLEGAFDFSDSGYIAELFQNCSYLKPMAIDASSGVNITRLALGADTSYQINGIKALTVSPLAPFSSNDIPQLDVSYTGLDKGALVNLFKSLPYNVGYAVTGSPTITDGVVSNFGDSNYLQIPALPGAQDYFDAVNPFEMVLRITTGTITRQQYVYYGDFALSITASKNLQLYYYDGEGIFVSGTATLQDNTSYDIKLTYDGANIIVSYKTGNNAYTQDIVATGQITKLADTETFGNRPTFNDAYFQGTMDIANSCISSNGIPWFMGFASMTKTCSVVGCAGTSDLTQADKDIALNKGWSLTVA